MYHRLLTYDLKDGSSEDYLDLYELLDNYTAIKLTESSYFIKTNDDYDTFRNKVLKATSSGDIVFAIVLSEGSMEYRKIR
jgi:hypothetical protein